MYYTLHKGFFVKNNYILQNKTFIRRVVLFYTVLRVFNIWPGRRQLDSHISTSVFSLYDILFWFKYIKYMKKMWSHTGSWKRQGYFNSFSK